MEGRSRENCRPHVLSNTIPPKDSGKVVKFPDPWLLPDDADGLIYVGGNLEIKTLIQAYSLGIYPWPLEEIYPVFWFCPEQRGILEFSNLHIPRSLQKIIKKEQFHFTVNKAFPEVIAQCSIQPRPGQEGTWITSSMHKAYLKMHQAGYAHSIECWKNDQLVGGLYGVFIKGVFSGESMFHLEPNASKLCLIELVSRLKGFGLTWCDIQMITPVTKAMGGHYISRRDFLFRLRETRKQPILTKLPWGR